MLTHPLFKSGLAEKIPTKDWALAAIAVTSCLYLFSNKYAISDHAGWPTNANIVMSTIGVVCLAIAVFRALGLPLVIVTSTFLVYVFFGPLSIMPEAIQWKGASFGKANWTSLFGAPFF